MRVSRRWVLLGGSAIVAVFGFGVMRARRPKTFKEMGREALARVFGDGGRGAAAEEFLADAIVFLDGERQKTEPLTLFVMDPVYGLEEGHPLADWMAQFMVHRFAMSSTVIAAAETGTAVEYTGFFDPLQGPCQNQLSVLFAPETG